MDEKTVPQQAVNQPQTNERTKFCKHCGERIPFDAVICTKCGCQVEEIHQKEQPSVVINNTNTNANVNQNVNQNYNPRMFKREINKWVALLLCFFLGFLGAHKFYEKKIGMGILYLFTCGLFGVGILIDFIVILFKPNPYYV